MTRGKPIYLGGNDDEPEKVVTRKQAGTGEREPATGLTGLSFRLAATPSGVAIHATLNQSATERGSLGIYSAIFEGSDLDAHLGSVTYIGKDIYEIFGNDADIHYTTVRRVIAERP